MSFQRLGERRHKLGQPTAILRAAVGSEIGFGHLMRCVAVAEGLQEYGVHAIFLLKHDEPGATELTRRGLRIEHFAGGSIEEDAAAVTHMARWHNAALVVTDVCHPRLLAQPKRLDAFHRTLKAGGAFLVVLAAGPHLDPVADVVVNPYHLRREGGEPSQLAGKLLWGVRYFILRREIARAARTPRRTRPTVEHLLVAVGGSDPACLTGRILEALREIDLRGVGIRVVVGGGVDPAEREVVSFAAARLAARTEVLHQPDDMAALFLWADLALTGDGLTKYETAATGTPSIIVSRPDDNTQINEDFLAAATALHVCPAVDGGLTGLPHALRQLMGDGALRETMAIRGRALVDGEGLERVLAEIPVVPS